MIWTCLCSLCLVYVATATQQQQPILVLTSVPTRYSSSRQSTTTLLLLIYALLQLFIFALLQLFPEMEDPSSPFTQFHPSEEAIRMWTNATTTNHDGLFLPFKQQATSCCCVVIPISRRPLSSSDCCRFCCSCQSCLRVIGE
jgi:hypothetical protein